MSPEMLCMYVYIFFFNDTATTEIYTLSLHDALPISNTPLPTNTATNTPTRTSTATNTPLPTNTATNTPLPTNTDRKSTRLNSSHANISYAVFCLKKKKQIHTNIRTSPNHKTLKDILP